MLDHVEGHLGGHLGASSCVYFFGGFLSSSLCLPYDFITFSYALSIFFFMVSSVPPYASPMISLHFPMPCPYFYVFLMVSVAPPYVSLMISLHFPMPCP